MGVFVFPVFYVTFRQNVEPTFAFWAPRRGQTLKNVQLACFMFCWAFFVDGPCTKPGTTLQRNAQKNEGHFSVPAFLNQEAPIFNVDVTNASEKLTFELPYLWCPRSAALRAAAIFRTPSHTKCLLFHRRVLQLFKQVSPLSRQLVFFVLFDISLKSV